MSSNVKSFVSEKQIEEKRKARQEEWERVRNPEDPVTAPEETYDPRSLYERLKEQKDRKQEDFEEQLKFKNHFRGINQEESAFLSDVNKLSSEIERKKALEEKQELDDFKNAVAQSRELPEVSIEVSKESDAALAKTSKKPASAKKSNQHNILKAAVKRKAESDKSTGEIPPKISIKADDKVPENMPISQSTIVYPSVTKCVGILPGLAAYSEDSGGSEAEDTSSDEEGFVSTNLLSSIVRNQEQ